MSPILQETLRNSCGSRFVWMELTEDFPISYPVPLEEYRNSILKDLR